MDSSLRYMVPKDLTFFVNVKLTVGLGLYYSNMKNMLIFLPLCIALSTVLSLYVIN